MRFELLDGVRSMGTFGGVRQAKNAAGCLVTAVGDSVAYWSRRSITRITASGRVPGPTPTDTRSSPVNEPNEPHRSGR